MEVCFFLYSFVMKDTHVRNRVFFFEIRIFNERCAKWVNYAPKAYGNVPSCLVSVAFIQGMFVLQRNYIVSLCSYSFVVLE